ncbi:ankyrin repeat protein [Penicillium lagena]|uniref:ankyrin repeat protein n=1 Tax=Penicillium lagena TaxID=94218 RepID=UPI0025425B8D|nr:ankyrin repeat protein [Penicillium lagena]KAJ5612862.1 ankyrin repeat protein [Penicillium lagena]
MASPDSEALCQTISLADIQPFEEYLKRGNIDFNHRDCTGRTPLQLACVASSPAIVRSLIEAGAHITPRTKDGQTALHLAAKRGNAEIIRILLSKSAENKHKAYPTGGHSPGSGEELDNELDTDEHGDSVHLLRIDPTDRSPARRIFEDIDEVGADVYKHPDVISWKDFTTPLHLAILHGHTEAVVELLSFGANPVTSLRTYPPASDLLIPRFRPQTGLLPTLYLSLLLPREKAREISRILLDESGVSVAQVNPTRTTLLQYIVASGYDELLDLYTQIDEKGFKLALDYVYVKPALFPRVYSVLNTALDLKREAAAMKLLEAGAKPFIGYEDFIENVDFAKFRPPKRLDFSSRYYRLAGQPIISAVENELPRVAMEILRREADPCTWRYLSTGHTRGYSVLDAVCQKLESLKAFLSPSLHQQGALRPFDEHKEYFSGLAEGTYQMWAGKVILDRAHSCYKNMQRAHEGKKKEPNKPQGFDAKRQAVQSLIVDYEILKEELLARGAKPFKELHPEAPTSDRESQARREYTGDIYNRPALSPFESGQEAYLELFEAAWQGDSETIKRLALEKQGDNGLEVSKCDRLDLSPLSLATLRRHWDAARLIVRIYQAQSPKFVQPRYFFTDASLDRDAFNAFSHKAASLCMSMSTTGSDSNLHMNLMEHAVMENDPRLLAFLLEIGDLTSPYRHGRRLGTLSERYFLLAMKLGRVECLAEIITKTGFGIPLREPKIGENERAPKALPSAVNQPKRSERPPLLAAATQGNLAATKWFLGADPAGSYLQYVSTHPEEDRVQQFSQSGTSSKEALQTWLSWRDDLVLHCAVISEQCEESEGLIRYLVQNFPSYLNSRSTEGHTPLALAFSLQRTAFARILIDAGADQSAHDRFGNNILHLTLVSIEWEACKNPHALTEMVGLLDRQIIPSLLNKRCQRHLTPLARWMSYCEGSYRPLHYPSRDNDPNRDNRLAIAEFLLDLGESSRQNQLELRDARGNTPAHIAVMKQFPDILRAILDRLPDMLSWENSSGNTVLETARDAWVELVLGDQALLLDIQWPALSRKPGIQDDLIDRDPRYFVSSPLDARKVPQITYELCLEWDRLHPGQRKLFSRKMADDLLLGKHTRWGHCLEDWLFRVGRDVV